MKPKAEVGDIVTTYYDVFKVKNIILEKEPNYETSKFEDIYYYETESLTRTWQGKPECHTFPHDRISKSKPETIEKIFQERIQEKYTKIHDYMNDIQYLQDEIEEVESDIYRLEETKKEILNARE